MTGPSRRPRVTFIGRYGLGPLDIVRSIFFGLNEAGAVVQEIDLGCHRDIKDNPYRRLGGNGPVYLKLDRIKGALNQFQPGLIILCAGGLAFRPADLNQLKPRCVVTAITLSDPDVFETVSKYAGDFDLHTTNSVAALQRYSQLKLTNTTLMPFAADSRFFVPRPVDPAWASEVAIIGDARPDRLPVAEQLVRRFKTRLYGRGWPWASGGPVYGEDWMRAAYSSRFLVNFSRTRAGHTNVKVGVFEATATGRLLFADRFAELGRYFRYDKEIVGYNTPAELVQKIDYYLAHPHEAVRIAGAGQLRCARSHTWRRRLGELVRQAVHLPGRRVWQELG